MSRIKKKSINSLADGIFKFEESKDAVKNSDYTDLNTFIKDFLNTPEPKQRRKLAEEFRKRHLELYDFIKNNAQLISAETEIARIVQAALVGEEQAADNKQLTNLLEMIEKGLGGEKK
ncbi:MAG: hypothetical protein IJX77_09555 [Ruminococcus sp.]|nr:hypothetical protein [Ruminococcus sp.]